MSGIWGRKIGLSIFGESHGQAIGITINGLPSGVRLDMQEIEFQMARRAPGGEFSTPRKEADKVEIVSGILDGRTTGAPLTGIIYNTNTRSGDYNQAVPRPSHSDWGYYVKTHGNNDYRGGGHSSGRITAPLVFAGAICRQILSHKGIEVGSHILAVKDNYDKRFGNDIIPCMLDDLSHSAFPLLDERMKDIMQDAIRSAQHNGDSVGGKIQCAVTGMPAGVGDPFFHSVESVLSSLLFSVPAVKSVSFGESQDLSTKLGSEVNDEFCYHNGKVVTTTNNNGGILGGITIGMPIVFEVVIKPTPSIFKEQNSVDLVKGENCKLTIQGRHDPCILVRALPVVEAVTAIAMLECLGE